MTAPAARKSPPTANPTAYASLDQLLSDSQEALQRFREALVHGGRAHVGAAIKHIKSHGIDPDQVAIRCASSKDMFWYHPAALVLAIARPNAHLLLQEMIDQAMVITRHQSGQMELGSFRPLAHAFVQGWSAARPAPVPRRRTDPNGLVVDDLFEDLDGILHRLDSRALLKLFSEQKLDWAATSSAGQSILHQAMIECNPEDLRTVVLMGMGHGLAPSAKDHEGRSAIDLGRLRMAQETCPGPARDALEFILAEMAQADMAHCTTSPALDIIPSRPRI